MPYTKLEKIGQLFSPAAFVHDSEEHIQEMEKLIRDFHIGGITFFHSRQSAAANFEKRQEVLDVENTYERMLALIHRFQKISKTPLLISIDAEFGLAMRIEKTPQYPYAISMGAIPQTEKKLVFETGFRIGQDLKKSGIHINFAPVADINTNPENPVIGYRSFGPDKEKVSAFALAMYQGMVAAGISACYKHFPGHGDTHVDSHLGLPIIPKSKKQLLEEELYPFVKGIEAGVEMIMVGHLAAPALTGGENIPASISHYIITGLLKNEMGFEGIIVSDALNMKSVSALFPIPGQLEWEAFHAGNDLLCFSENVPEGIQWISERSSPERLEESFGKIIKLKNKLGIAENTPVPKPEFEYEEINSFNMTLAQNYLTVLKNPEPLSALENAQRSSQLAKVSLFSSKENVFFNSIDQTLSGDSFNANQLGSDWTSSLESYSEILIAIFVPSAKPLNHFGMDTAQLEKLSALAVQKNCHLYFFGNPLAIRKIEKLEHFKTIVCAFQGFDVSQKVAAKQLLGKMKAIGKLQGSF
ncbi:hypothetical protein P872_07250 [Rhodonellum psychrophilum GCM71 = DSM 17998]|uniref:beta-N-acetylhexosaminidase n=1 Tax=Rhodonellum psychrophilum GCM71 = DSM 17998 TaxID=1123057 RepID=U5BNR9_9BACT|nr:glycoside hydrolase family 3 N-terminal domain-containing protein [Rhodonellum psychrophilum]ERM82195.1 hypothetical protein P872_07250 [Rhodonellum psychrophilum GCM71 = DSM 17998]